MSTPSWGDLAKLFTPSGSIFSQQLKEDPGWDLGASQPGPWARTQVAQEALAAVGGVGGQAQQEIVVWAGAGALLGDPLPKGQKAWPREGREWD